MYKFILSRILIPDPLITDYCSLLELGEARGSYIK